MTNIPSDEEFEKAHKEMEKWGRDTDKVRNSVLRYFQPICPIHAIYIGPRYDAGFNVYVFFEKNKDIETYEKNGLTKYLIGMVYEELERAGLGGPDEVKVLFNFDSYENVKKKCNGNYHKYLR